MDWVRIDRAVAKLRRLFGLRKYATLTLKRGYVQNRTLADWFREVQTGRRNPRTIVIKRSEAGRRTNWCAANAWPKKFESSDLNSTANEVKIDSVELVHEGIKAESS